MVTVTTKDILSFLNGGALRMILNMTLHFKARVGTGWEEARMAASQGWALPAAPPHPSTPAVRPVAAVFLWGSRLSRFFSFAAFHPIPLLSLFSSTPFCFPEQDQDMFSPSFLTQPNSSLPAWPRQITSALHRGAVFNLL